jgi:replicative DNA helicase
MGILTMETKSSPPKEKILRPPLPPTYPEPPSNIDAEQALLGAILIDNSIIDKVTSIISKADFYDQIHAEIFRIAVEMRANGELVSAITLRPHVIDWPPINEHMAVWQYLGKLTAQMTGTRHAVDYAKEVRDQSYRDKLYVAFTDGLYACVNPEQPAVVTVGHAIRAFGNLMTLASSFTENGSSTLSDMMSDAYDAAMSDNKDSCIPTGFARLDDALSGGWQRKQYVILAGRPGMGKTTLAASAMLRTAKAGHGVLMFSAEMSKRRLTFRMMTDLTYSPERRTTYKAFQNNKMNDQERAILAEASVKHRSLPIAVVDKPKLTAAQITSEAIMEKHRFSEAGVKLGMIIVDHIGQIAASDRYRGNRVHEVTEISNQLRTLAKELDVVVLALCQLNRATETRENKRPTLADLRDSGSLEQDADVVMFCYRESYYLGLTQYAPGSPEESQRLIDLDAHKDRLDLLMAKNRDGPTTTIPLFCDIACNAVRDLK